MKKLPFDELNAQGYSLGVRLIWLMKKLKVNLIETLFTSKIEIVENLKFQSFK